jgi:broad specificity phosphatase PhoE
VHLYFARHGESEANVLKIFSNETGSYGLTEKGRTQAAALAELLAPEGLTRAFTSPLLRAVQTAEIVCSRLNIPFEARNALREFGVGDHEGSCQLHAWEEYNQVEKAWLIDGNTKARIGGGECLDDISLRFMPFIDEVIHSFGETDERILLIGHGGTFACMLPNLFSNIDRGFALEHHISNAGFILGEYCKPQFICQRWVDVLFEASCG